MTSSETYLKHIDAIVYAGLEVSARGLHFRECIGQSYVVPMKDPVIRIPKRKLGFRFAAAEPYWILSGSNLLSVISPYGKMAPYSDDGFFMSGAYGPKIVDQLGYICKTLAADLGSRQAVLTIWRERPGKSKDIPCTVAMQFLVRDNEIHCITFMRSSDAIMGLPYDSIMFSLTSAYILSILSHHYGVKGMKLGTLQVTIGSSHIYNKDIGLARSMLDSHDYEVDPLDFNELAKKSPDDFLLALKTCAADEGGNGILDATR